MCVTLTTCDEQRAAVGAPELANAMERTAETTDDGLRNSWMRSCTAMLSFGTLTNC